MDREDRKCRLPRAHLDVVVVSHSKILRASLTFIGGPGRDCAELDRISSGVTLTSTCYRYIVNLSLIIHDMLDISHRTVPTKEHERHTMRNEFHSRHHHDHDPADHLRRASLRARSRGFDGFGFPAAPPASADSDHAASCRPAPSASGAAMCASPSCPCSPSSRATATGSSRRSPIAPAARGTRAPARCTPPCSNSSMRNSSSPSAKASAPTSN